MNHDDEDDSDGGDCSDESCELSYGQPYHLQLVTENQDLQRWLTGSRSSKDRYGRPRGGNGDSVYTEDGADNGGNAGNFKINPNQYRWLIRSDPSNGSRLGTFYVIISLPYSCFVEISDNLSFIFLHSNNLYHPQTRTDKLSGKIRSETNV